jgi:hypothetical protein
MATNFLIALATAFGSTALILVVLRVGLKLIVPNAFKEVIPVPAKVAQSQATPIVTTAPIPVQQVIIDDITLSALFPGQQIVDLKEQPQQIIYNYFPITGSPIAALLSGRRQAARRFTIVGGEAKEKEEEEKKTPSGEEILSPRGQSTPHFGIAAKKSSGVPNEAICGSAR